MWTCRETREKKGQDLTRKFIRAYRSRTFSKGGEQKRGGEREQERERDPLTEFQSLKVKQALQNDQMLQCDRFKHIFYAACGILGTLWLVFHSDFPEEETGREGEFVAWWAGRSRKFVIHFLRTDRRETNVFMGIGETKRVCGAVQNGGLLMEQFLSEYTTCTMPVKFVKLALGSWVPPWCG